jgi:Skp family chaperone for outer membrane proteins
MSLTKKDLEDLVKKHQTNLATVNSKLSTLSDLAESIEEMKRLLTASTEENERLKKHLCTG